MTFEGTTWTNAQMPGRIDRLSGALRTAGALRTPGDCRGDRAAFLGVNQPGYFDLMSAAAGRGAIFAPLNFRLTGPGLVFGPCKMHSF